MTVLPDVICDQLATLAVRGLADRQSGSQGTTMARNILRWPTDAERTRIDQIIARHHDDRPDGVKRVTSSFREDHDGVPAVFLEMVVSSEVKPTKEKIAELNDYIQVILNDIIGDDEIDYWPYARTVTEE
jgi:hypothetical protein